MLTKLCSSRHQQTRRLGWAGESTGGSFYTAIMLKLVKFGLNVELFWFKILSESKTKQTKVVFKCLKSPLCSHDWQTEEERDIDENICLFCLSTQVTMIQGNYKPHEMNSPTTRGGSTWRWRVTLSSPISFLAVHLYWPPSSGLASSTSSMWATE